MSGRTPHETPSDADLMADMARLDDLGLPGLAAGPGPDDARWADVQSRARRHRRRRWVPAAVAAVALVVIGGVALAVVGGHDDASVSVDTPSTPERSYLLPPPEAPEIGFQLALDDVEAPAPGEVPSPERVALSTVEWGEAGARWSLTTGAPNLGSAPDEPTTPTTPLEHVGALDVEITCTTTSSVGGAETGTVGARGRLTDGSWFILEPVPAEGDRLSLDRCDDSPGAAAAARAAVASLRIVDGTTWRRFLLDHVATNTLDPSRTTSTTAAGTAETASTLTPSPAPPCDAGLMWASAVRSGIDPNDPGYADIIASGGRPEVVHPVCIEEWAFAAIVRPYTDVTDANDVFHWVGGRWDYFAKAGYPPTACDYQRVGVPLPIIDVLIPPNRRGIELEQECWDGIASGAWDRQDPAPSGTP